MKMPEKYNYLKYNLYQVSALPAAINNTIGKTSVINTADYWLYQL